MGVLCVLPARLSSTRIPRKPLQEIAGRPLIEWAWRAARAVPDFDRVVIATDSSEVVECAEDFGAEAVMTRSDHRSGTDRVEEAAQRVGVGDEDIVVNFQADEPFVDAGTLSNALRALPEAAIATLAVRIRDRLELESPGVVKVVRAVDGRALYFTRAPVPFLRDGEPRFEDGPPVFLRHVGVYACTRSSLRSWAAREESPLEAVERLEQLRALEARMRIHVEIGPPMEAGVDLPADLERAERVLSTGH